MNTTPDQSAQSPKLPSPEKPDDRRLLDALLAASDPPTKTDLSAAFLERALREESDQRKTERFFWIAICMILFDTIAAALNAWSLTILFPLEVGLLIGLANWLEVDFVKKPLQQLLDGQTRKKRD